MTLEEKEKAEKIKKTGCLIAIAVSVVLVFVILLIIRFILNPGHIKACKELSPRTTLTQFKKKFGSPLYEKVFGNHKWVYFKSDPIAAGPIRIRVNVKTNAVIELKCTQNGASEWVNRR